MGDKFIAEVAEGLSECEWLVDEVLEIGQSLLSERGWLCLGLSQTLSEARWAVKGAQSDTSAFCLKWRNTG